MTNKKLILKMTLILGGYLFLVGCAGATSASNTASSSSLFTTPTSTSTSTDTSTDTSSTTTTSTTGDVIPLNSGLYAGQSFTGTNAGLTLSYQYDGNLVVYNSSATALWSSRTSGKCSYSCYMVFQNDGNLVLYSAGKAYWSSSTAASQLKNDYATQLIFSSSAPYLSIEDDSNTVLWTSTANN